MFLTPEPSVLAQGCVPSPLLSILRQLHLSHESVKLLKSADDTTLIRLISDGDESAYRWEIDHLVKQHDLKLNAVKTVEMVNDIRKNPATLVLIILCNSSVETAGEWLL